MATNSPVFIVGRDVSVILIAPNNQRFDVTNLTMFTMKPEYTVAVCRPLNTPPGEKHLPSGWRGDFSFERKDATNDKIFLSIEQGWWNAGSAQGGVGNTGSCTVFVNEVNGSRTVMQWEGVAIWQESFLDASQDKPVPQKIGMFASKRTK